MSQPDGTRAMNQPRVSVIMAARNASETIEPALRSLLRQTLQDWECLLVDDSSSDATAEIARRYARADPRIRVLENPAEQQGVVAARNLAATAARGTAIAILDADDWAHRDRLALQWQQLELQGGGVVSCFPRYFPRRALGPGMLRYEAWLRRQSSGTRVLRARYIEMPYAHSSLLIERSLGDRLAWYRDQSGPEDYEFALRLAASGAPHGVVKRVLLGWRLRAESASRTQARYSLAAFMHCRAEALARDFLSKQDAWTLWGHGATGKALRLALAQLDQRPRAILEVDPRKIGQAIEGVPVLDAQGWLAQPGSEKLIISVAGSSARQSMRKALAATGKVEGEGFIFAA